MTTAQPLRIDVHAHLGGTGACGSGIHVSPRFRRGIVFRIIMKTLDVGPAQMHRADDLFAERLATLVRESTAYDKAVALALDGRWVAGRLDLDRSPLIVPNDWSRDMSRRHPELLYGASVSPLRPDALDELDRVAADGAVLVKWLPNVMGIDPGDVAHVPFYRKLAALGMPLLTHSGHEFTLPGGEARLGNPSRLERALDEGVTVIAAHAGTLCMSHGAVSGTGVACLAELAARYPRLHADLSALTTWLRGWQLRSVLDEPRLAGRLIDASDFPVPCAPWTQLGRVSWADLRRARAISNPFDRDRALKLAAGMTADATTRAMSVLRLSNGDGQVVGSSVGRPSARS